jgi:HAD superfamily hydrolase (TIGR01509 family)
MQPLEAIIFDFDGVLLESEFEGNLQLAELLAELGHPHTPEETLRFYVGLSGRDFVAAIEERIGGSLPAEFHERRRLQSIQALEKGVRAVIGAVEFVRSLPPGLPRAIASSSSTRWIRGHLRHLGLESAFETHIYSGREHVERGKPAPDLYWHAARALGVDIERCVIIEDSPVGARGALASGATVIGLAAGRHCLEGHSDLLRDLGVRQVAESFDELAKLLGIAQPSR